MHLGNVSFNYLSSAKRGALVGVGHLVCRSKTPPFRIKSSSVLLSTMSGTVCGIIDMRHDLTAIGGYP